MELKEIAKLPPEVQRQILEKLGKAAAKSKYRNRKTEVNGIRFDSQKEANRYLELLALEQAGKIRALRLQPDFTLTEAYTDAHSGKRERASVYRADFAYQERDTEAENRARFYGEDRQIWRDVVEDVKGKRTANYITKRKVVFDKFGIRIGET